MVAPPPLYYLDNFQVLLDHARGNYADLLTAGETRFIGQFTALSVPARCLYVRMLTRRVGLLRADRLTYTEVPDTTVAANELAAQEMLEVDPIAPAATLLQLLTLPELLPLARACGLTRNAGKRTLVEALAAAGDDATHAALCMRLRWYRLGQREIVDTLSLLFFGNRHQDLSTFVVTQLGHLKFESYPLDRLRQFQDRADFDAYKGWLDLGDAVHQALAERDLVAALAAAQYCLARGPHRLAPWRRDRVLTQLTRFFERENCSEMALTLAAATVDSAAAGQRARLIRKRRGDVVADTPPRRANLLAERPLRLPEWQPGMVEQQALAALSAAGYRGAHLENQFPCALFGLLCWDILFTPLPGAFFNAYQLGPLDLFTPQFPQRRAAALQERFAGMHAGHGEWRQRMSRTFAAKHGIANHFVNWRDLDGPTFAALCTALPDSLAAAICARVASDPRRYRRGFPDLALLAPTGDLQFCEVKSPNDQLSAEQRDWLAFLRDHGSEAWVARIVVPAGTDPAWRS